MGADAPVPDCLLGLGDIYIERRHVMTEREALKLALEALQKIYIAPEHEEYIRVWWPACEQAITAIKEALAQPEQEPVETDWERIARVQDAKLRAMCNEAGGFEKLCEVMDKYERTTPPQRKPLTDEEIKKCYETTGHCQTLRPQDRFAVFALARAIEAAHGIKGEA